MTPGGEIVVVPRGPHNEDAAAVRKLDRPDHVGDLGSPHVGGELEREVDHVRAPASGVADCACDVSGIALAVAVEHGTWFSIDSDAHATGQLEWQPNGCEKAAEGEVPIERIINTFRADELLEWTVSRA